MDWALAERSGRPLTRRGHRRGSTSSRAVCNYSLESACACIYVSDRGDRSLVKLGLLFVHTGRARPGVRRVRSAGHYTVHEGLLKYIHTPFEF